MRGKLDPTGSEGQWILRVHFYDSNGGYIYNPKDVDSGQAGSLSTTWQYVGGRLTTLANTASIRLQLINYMNSGWLALDDVSLTPAAPTVEVRKYYYANGQRIAMRQGTSTSITGLRWLLTDHLGSTSLIADATGARISELRYMPWGEPRFASGNTPTDFHFTGQRDQGYGLIDYGARFYSPYITQFTQPDAIIPDPYNPLDWNRYAYARSNPLRYVDPTGHIPGPPPVCPNGCTIWDYSGVGGSGFGGRLVRALISTGTELVDFLITNGATQTDPQACTWNLAGTEERFIAGTIPPMLLGVTGGRQLPLPGFEDILHTQVSGKLSESASNAFRNEARGIFYEVHSRLAGQGLQVHHRIPLEWAHLFPEANPNRLSNLIGLDPLIHRQINLEWSDFKAYYRQLGRSPTAKEILEFAAGVDKEFSQSYNRLLERRKR